MTSEISKFQHQQWSTRGVISCQPMIIMGRLLLISSRGFSGIYISSSDYQTKET
jgi:hypothetical protein